MTGLERAGPPSLPDSRERGPERRRRGRDLAGGRCESDCARHLRLGRPPGRHRGTPLQRFVPTAHSARPRCGCGTPGDAAAILSRSAAASPAHAHAARGSCSAGTNNVQLTAVGDGAADGRCARTGCTQPRWQLATPPRRTRPRAMPACPGPAGPASGLTGLPRLAVGHRPRPARGRGRAPAPARGAGARARVTDAHVDFARHCSSH